MVERRRSTGRPARTRRWPRLGRHCPRKVQPRAWATCLDGGRLWQQRGDAVVALYGTSAELGMGRPRGSSAGGRASLGGIEEGVRQHGVHGGGMVPSPGSRRGKGKGEGEIGEGRGARVIYRSTTRRSWRPCKQGERHATCSAWCTVGTVHQFQISNSTSNIPLKPILRASVTPKPRRVSKNSINKSCRSTYQL